MNKATSNTQKNDFSKGSVAGNILKLASDYRVEEIIIAIATPQSDLKPLIEKCLATGCHVRRMTLLQDVNGENAQQSQVRDININDLLGRPEEHPEGFGAVAGEPSAHNSRGNPRRTR